jgi:hypothetical protein
VRGERVAKRIFIGVNAQVSYVNPQGSISEHVRVTAGLALVVPPSFTTHEAVIKGRLAAACRGNNLSLRLPAVATWPFSKSFRYLLAGARIWLSDRRHPLGPDAANCCEHPARDRPRLRRGVRATGFRVARCPLRSR